MMLKIDCVGYDPDEVKKQLEELRATDPDKAVPVYYAGKIVGRASLIYRVRGGLEIDTVFQWPLTPYTNGIPPGLHHLVIEVAGKSIGLKVERLRIIPMPLTGWTF